MTAKAFSVALIGPDGSGKSTISERLLSEAPFPTERIYMGINRKESNYALPTTRFVSWVRRLLKKEADQGGPRDVSKEETPSSKSSSPAKRIFKEAKSGLVLLNRIVEEWYRQLIAWRFIRQGKVVVFDRHFYADFHQYDVNATNRRWVERIHGYMLEHIYPKPDLVIYLDAPADVLFARKGEGTVELLEERRQAYMEIREKVPHFEIVDTNQPVDTVYANVLQIISDFQQSRIK